MVTKGPAKKLTVFVDETDKFHGKPVYEVLLDIFFKKKIMGVSVFRGIAGYGSDGVFHTSKMLELSSSMPVKIEVVESEEMIDKVLPDIYHVVEKGMVEVTDTNVVKCCPKAEEKRKEQGEHMKLEGKAKMLRIVISEDDVWEGEPLYQAIVKRLIMADIAGATVYKAIAGYGPHKRYHKKKTLTVHGELPILITVMDSEEKINTVIPILDELVGEGIVVLSDVNVIKYTHRDAASGIESAM
jgi:PII-like signaling protein